MAGAQSAGIDPPIRVGRYEVLGEIASGGMATVYLARTVGAAGFSRLVAIKKLHEHLQADEDFVAMLLDEARLAARIRHPNVVPVVDMEASPSLYLVMEYIEGDKLSGLIKLLARQNQRLPIPIALRVIHDTLEGLHAAHELCDENGRPLRIIHRDVSPQNILVGVDGVSRITDFGIAKAESRATATRDGELKGKVGYMAPEQLGADEIDRRVDLFAMGVTLWESLAGRRLFHRDTEVETMGAVAAAPIPTLTAAPFRVPPEIDAMLRRALERKPRDRYSSAREFADALEASARAVGGLASTRAVADLVAEVAGEKIERERNRTREALSFSTTTPISRTGIPAPSAPAAELAPAPPRENTVVSGVEIKRDTAVAARPAQPSNTLLFVFVAIGAVAFSSAITAFLMRHRHTQTAAVAHPTRAASPVVVIPQTPHETPVTPAVDASTASAVITQDAAVIAMDRSDASTAAAPSHGAHSASTHRSHEHQDDSEFLGVNPYQH